MSYAAIALAIVKSTHPAPGRPNVRITRELPPDVAPAAAVEMARARAKADPGHRFRVLQARRGDPEPHVLWDSHAPS
jgi:hypothetical protein